jgi:hypothetical protein
MTHTKKVWIVIVSFFLMLVIIACSCGSILPALQTVVTQVSQPSPTVGTAPTVPPEPTIAPQTQASAVGRWEDPDSEAPYSITTIAEQNGEYVVVSVTNSGRNNVNELTYSKIVNGVLTWEYCPEGMYCITSELVSITSDSLTATWYWTDDSSTGGTTIYRRVP